MEQGGDKPPVQAADGAPAGWNNRPSNGVLQLTWVVDSSILAGTFINRLICGKSQVVTNFRGRYTGPHYPAGFDFGLALSCSNGDDYQIVND